MCSIYNVCCWQRLLTQELLRHINPVLLKDATSSPHLSEAGSVFVECGQGVRVCMPELPSRTSKHAQTYPYFCLLVYTCMYNMSGDLFLAGTCYLVVGVYMYTCIHHVYMYT